MINATDAVDLCCKATKHMKYLQNQVERSQYCYDKGVGNYDMLIAYKNALDNFETVFELEKSK
jgi:hypothetical protein